MTTLADTRRIIAAAEQKSEEIGQSGDQIFAIHASIAEPGVTVS